MQLQGTFAWIQLHLVSFKCVKGFLKLIQMLHLLRALNQHAINIYFNVLPNLWTIRTVN